jgi:hypothetical protein
MAEKKSRNEKPVWVDPALQGLAYWMGYRKQLYRHHLLPEGAMVAELATIINGNLGKGERLECEYLYSKATDADDRSLVDIAILKDDVPHTFIEVKRGDAWIRLLEKDMLKLLRVKSAFPSIRCYLIIGSQGLMPGRFVDSKKGIAIKGLSMTRDDVVYKVLRVCKAAPSFNKMNSAMYSCLLEVL